jgi:glutaredoxin
MKQQCYLAAIYLNWLLLVGGAGYLLFTHRYGFAFTWLIVLPLAMRGYIHAFPSFSQAMGYGTVNDCQAELIKTTASRDNSTTVKVTLYTALGCPFCPIVEKRLRALGESLGFEIEKIDVTLRPDLLASKDIQAVPVVEVEERRLQGNATSEQLTEVILGKPAVAGTE